MVLLPEGFCIDSTPVTRAQYRAWLETNPSLEGQHKRCREWNDSYEPSEYCESKAEGFWEWEDEHPQSCMDWCDANAYCYYAGKRLCGRIGGGPTAGGLPGPGGLEGRVDPTVSQWFAACSSGGANSYPYGDEFDETACNAQGPGSGPTPVGSLPGCQSAVPGYQGVYDMSGNFAELVDDCGPDSDPMWPDDGSYDNCIARGGSFGSDPEELRCDHTIAVGRDSTGHMFRCCYP